MDETTPQQQVKPIRIIAESAWLKRSLALFVLTAISGLLVALPLNSFPIWLQLNVLGHVLLGSVLFLPLSIYIYVHFKRTAGIRRPSLIFSGLLTSLLLFALFLGGFWFAWHGQSETNGWIPELHTISAYLVMGLTIVHGVIHARLKRKEQTSGLFRTIESASLKSIITALIGYFLGLMLLWIGYTALIDSEQLKSEELQKLAEYEDTYGDHPFRPSQTETSTGNFINVAQIAKSDQCGTCHSDIYDQWVSSTHRQAASDPAYVKNINLLEKKRGIAATRYCEGCHAPVALLTGELTLGGQHGGVKGTPANTEGVGCMGCHGIAGIIHTNGTASYTFDPKEHYLFDSSTNPSAQKLRNFLIRLHPDQHKSAMGSDIISDPKVCATCHEQFMDKSMNNWGWVKMQSDYTNWLKSPFSGQDEQEFQHSTTMRCQDCHFPLVDGDDPSANASNQIRSHRSPGGNTFLPKLTGDDEQFEITKRFLQAGRLRVDIEEPDRPDTLLNHQTIEPNKRSDGNDNTPYFLYLGEQANLRVTVYNQMVGHSFPAGTTDLNQAWLNIKVSDVEGRVVYQSGTLNDKLEVDKSAHSYHTTPVDRQGKEIWRHDLFRMVGERYKNLIPAGGSDIVEYSFQVPSWAKQPLTMTAVLKYRKLNQKYARWVFDTEKPILPIIDIARDTLTIPLRTKPITTTRDNPTSN